ncbi:Scr1 family TA system antitoxin-like transcriptional regulator [Streptomyces sp. NPDC087425]|uniref:helix-turn-helix domain-containing protein n=1 Tax=Streptomyces sp. NPDC087425 TaxID=3365787 RepID=UPI003819699D
MASTYGEWLKERREAAGLTQQQLADLTLMTRSHIAHIEAGRRFPSEEDARRLDMALKTGNVLATFRPGRDESPVADYFEAARQLEQEATVIREFAPTFVPGVLQTERYARAVLGVAYPPESEEERDKKVVARLERSKILANPVTPVVWTLLDEAVLRRPLGSPEVMAEQLMHLVALAESERVRVHVMPYSVGAHQILNSMLTLMWFADQPPVAYSEGIQFGRLHETPAIVERLQSVYHLALSDALPLRESLALLKATAKDFDHA